jgi:hypothetical protein
MEAQVTKRVGLFFFRPTLGGGTTTYTAHLFEALKAAGADPIILRVGETSGGGKRRTFGKYDGIEYMKISPAEAHDWVKNAPSIMTAPTGAKYMPYEPDIIMNLMKKGMRTVIHDPNEFTIYDHLGKAAKLPSEPICIRPTMQRFYPKAIFIPHPYAAQSPACYDDVRRAHVGGSTARIASVKRPKLLLEANRLVDERRRIQLRGAEYRMFTYNLQKKYGDVFQQCGGTFQFPMTFQAPVRVAAEFKLNFDMTWFPDDGGGTQYAQMEAMNAKTVNVMHEDWWRLEKEDKKMPKGEMRPGKHVLTVSGVPDIVKLLKKPPSPDQVSEINDNCARLLKNHAPAVIGKRYMEVLK